MKKKGVNTLIHINNIIVRRNNNNDNNNNSNKMIIISVNRKHKIHHTRTPPHAARLFAGYRSDFVCTVCYIGARIQNLCSSRLRRNAQPTDQPVDLHRSRSTIWPWLRLYHIVMRRTCSALLCSIVRYSTIQRVILYRFQRILILSFRSTVVLLLSI